MTVPYRNGDAARPGLAFFAGLRTGTFPRATQALGAERQWVIANARAMAEAKERARAALMAMLDETNCMTLAEHNYITVTGSLGTKFVIRCRDFQGNIDQYDEHGALVARWCAHPEMWDSAAGRYAPPEAAVIIQMLALQTDERAALSVALPH